MMKRIFLFSIMVLGSLMAYSKSRDTITSYHTNFVKNLSLKGNKLVVGGYGEIHYNQPINGSTYNNGNLDVHRVVMLLGYNFSNKTQFVSELEFEHVKEVYVEQAYLQHKLNKHINLRGGLMLVPMGIINEYHEPTTFNGVERPIIDKYIVPTTWREIGFGLSGSILPASIKYQAYVMNGFNGYDGSPKLSGKNGLRKGRQKGSESFSSSPNVVVKLEYFGIRGLNIGLSGYFGKTQSTLYDGVEKNDNAAVGVADSSVVGVSMVGLGARYNLNGLEIRSQLYYSSLSNSEQYNVFTADTEGKLNDLGSSMIGYYTEIGYNVLRPSKTKKKLVPFIRYEFLNTHNSVENNIRKNLTYKKTAITSGLTLTLTHGAVVKADIQLIKDAATKRYAKTFNTGIGVMF